MGKRQFGLGALQSLKNKNIRFNLRPFSNPVNLASETVEVSKEMSFVDLHLEVAQKVDALLAELEHEVQEPQEWEMAPKEELDLAQGKILSDIENSN